MLDVVTSTTFLHKFFSFCSTYKSSKLANVHPHKIATSKKKRDKLTQCYRKLFPNLCYFYTKFTRTLSLLSSKTLTLSLGEFML